MEAVFRNGTGFLAMASQSEPVARSVRKQCALVSGNELRDASNEPQGSTFPIKSGWMMRRRGGKEGGARGWGGVPVIVTFLLINHQKRRKFVFLADLGKSLTGFRLQANLNLNQIPCQV